MKVNRDGPAAQAGLLVGDKILSVNGTSLVNSEHTDAVMALKAAGDNITIVVLREVLSTNTEHSITDGRFLLKEGEKYSTLVERNDKYGGQFGFSIAGGNSTASTDRNENLYITKINDQDQNIALTVGDRLLSINGRDTTNLSHDQAIDMIAHSGNQIELVLYRERIMQTNENPSKSNTIDNTIEVSQEN